jgi:hypothetical protein
MILDKKAKEMNLRFFKKEGGRGNLINEKYTGICRVLNTRYLDNDTYDKDNPMGFRTGQCIDVEVIDGVVYCGKAFRKGDVVNNICSYGGDIGVVGKPQIGDTVGFYFDHYAEVWEKVEVSSR